MHNYCEPGFRAPTRMHDTRTDLRAHLRTFTVEPAVPIRRHISGKMVRPDGTVLRDAHFERDAKPLSATRTQDHSRLCTGESYWPLPGGASSRKPCTTLSITYRLEVNTPETELPTKQLTAVRAELA